MSFISDDGLRIVITRLVRVSNCLTQLCPWCQLFADGLSCYYKWTRNRQIPVLKTRNVDVGLFTVAKDVWCPGRGLVAPPQEASLCVVHRSAVYYSKLCCVFAPRVESSFTPSCQKRGLYNATSTMCQCDSLYSGSVCQFKGLSLRLSVCLYLCLTIL